MKTEKWEPEDWEIFYTFTTPVVRPDYFVPNMKNDYVGVYKTKRQAQTALKKLKKFIKEKL